jgi:hypothetical protein
VSARRTGLSINREQFDQRAKLDDYDDFVFIVVYAIVEGGEDPKEAVD